MEKDSFEKLLKERLGNHEMPVNSSLWNSVASQAGLSVGGTGLGIGAWLGISLSVVAITSTVLYFTLIKQDHPSTKTIIKEQKTTPLDSKKAIEGNENEEGHRPPIQGKEIELNSPKAFSGIISNPKVVPAEDQNTIVSNFQSNSEKRSTEVDISATTAFQSISTISQNVPFNDILPAIGSLVIEEKSIVTTKPITNEIINPNTEGSLNSLEQDNFILPNTFTPNGDGLNDELTLSLNGLSDISFVILDKNNKVIFSSNQSKIVWDGTQQNGDPIPSGTYHYFFTGKDHHGVWVNKQSSLTIVR